MFLLLILLCSNSVGPDDYIIVEAELGEFGVLQSHFQVEGCAVLNRESLEIDFSQ